MTAEIVHERSGPKTRAYRTHSEYTVIAQDPSVKDENGRILTARIMVPSARLEPGPRSARFHVVDYDATTGTYHPPGPVLERDDGFRDVNENVLSDHNFHAQQVYAVAARTLAVFEAALGRRLSWGFSGHQLHLVPHAFAEANAYYSLDDRALLFGYVPGEDGPTIYTCLSHDVIAHETTHAILDGLRHRFLEPGLPDQPAFHEGFSDVVALLSVFSQQPVVESCLGSAVNGRIDRFAVDVETLRKSVLTGVAEQLGDVLTQGRGALRQSALVIPPPGWASDPTWVEPHRRGEVLVATVLDVLIDIWTARLQALFDSGSGDGPQTLDRARAAEEGAKAAGHLLTMLIRGLDYLPPVEFEFCDFVDAVALADEELAPDDDLRYRQLLLDRFAEVDIRRPAGQARDLLIGNFVPRYYGLNFQSMRTSPDEVYRFLWENAEQLRLSTAYYTHVEAVRPSQRVGPDGLVVSEAVATYVQMLEMTAAEFKHYAALPLPEGLTEDTQLQLFGGGTLVFDQFGRAKLHIYKPLDDWERQARRLSYLHQASLYDSQARLGFSYGTARGQAFAALHSHSPNAGETW